MAGPGLRCSHKHSSSRAARMLEEHSARGGKVRVIQAPGDAGCGFISTEIGSVRVAGRYSYRSSGMPQCSEEAENLSAIVLPVLNP